MNDSVVFDVFFRRQPFNGGFSVLAGTAPLINDILNLHFSEDDISYLRSLGMFEEGFLKYLSDFKFSGNMYAFREGSLIFPQEPVVRIHANLIEAQILEGLILNSINFQSLIATKAARVWLSCGGKTLMEFGLRRAQGTDGALSATRACFIGGCTGTSNTEAGKKYGIPVMGTMAHSWVMSFPTELEAFEAYAELYPENTVFVIDTYDTLHSGIKNAIEVGKKLAAKGHSFGVRLDSGDISYLSREVRKQLDEAGFPDATISASNDLTEEIISALVQENAPVTGWGVGTNMVTGGSESSFSGVYKLAARIEKESGRIIPAMKFSDNPSKTTTPGIKNVWRLYDKDGFARADVMALNTEEIRIHEENRYFHPSGDYRSFSFCADKAEQMLVKVIENGKTVLPQKDEKETLSESRNRMMSQMKTLDASYKRILNPHIYKVSMTEQLKELKMAYIRANQS